MTSTTKESPFMLEIEGFEHTVEVLHSRFDNAIDLLPDKAVIFGGAIRDVLAKMELKADLDILCHSSLYGKVLKRKFLDDPCWCLVHDDNELMMVSETYGLSPPNSEILYNPNPSTEVKIEYGKDHKLPTITLPTITGPSRGAKASSGTDNLHKYLEQIISFVNVDGVTAQVMVVKQNLSEDLMGFPLALARQVDLICCGLVMTKEGRIYEVVPDAQKDCVNRVLRLNPNSQIISIKRTTKRIEKLVSRGWVSAITDKELAEAEKRAEFEVTKRVESFEARKLKPPTLRLERPSLFEGELYGGAPYHSELYAGELYSSEKRSRPAERIINTARIRSAGRPALGRPVFGDAPLTKKTVHTEIDVLERRVIDALHRRKSPPSDMPIEPPVLGLKDQIEEPPLETFGVEAEIEVRPNAILRYKPTYEPRSIACKPLSYRHEPVAKPRPKKPKHMFVDETVQVPNYFEHLHNVPNLYEHTQNQKSSDDLVDYGDIADSDSCDVDL